MSWNKKVPEFINEAVDDTIVIITKYCKSCDVIVNRVLINRSIISDEKLSRDSKEHLINLSLYNYYKGIQEALSLETDKAKEEMRITAKHKVIEYRPKSWKDDEK